MTATRPLRQPLDLIFSGFYIRLLATMFHSRGERSPFQWLCPPTFQLNSFYPNVIFLLVKFGWKKRITNVLLVLISVVSYNTICNQYTFTINLTFTNTYSQHPGLTILVTSGKHFRKSHQFAFFWLFDVWSIPLLSKYPIRIINFRTPSWSFSVYWVVVVQPHPFLLRSRQVKTHFPI